MNNLIKALLGSAAFSALTSGAAGAADAPIFHIASLHAGGKVVNKTKAHNHGATHVTYTFGVYTSVSASDFRKTVLLASTFYRWSSYDSCYAGGTEPKMSIKAQKRSTYAKIGTATETYSFRCPYGPSHFYGDTYKLKDASGFGQTDTFVSVLYGKFHNGSSKYKGTLNLDVNVAIGAEQSADSSN